VKVWLNGWVRP